MSPTYHRYSTDTIPTAVSADCWQVHRPTLSVDTQPILSADTRPTVYRPTVGRGRLKWTWSRNTRYSVSCVLVLSNNLCFKSLHAGTSIDMINFEAYEFVVKWRLPATSAWVGHSVLKITPTVHSALIKPCSMSFFRVFLGRGRRKPNPRREIRSTTGSQG